MEKRPQLFRWDTEEDGIAKCILRQTKEEVFRLDGNLIHERLAPTMAARGAIWFCSTRASQIRGGWTAKVDSYEDSRDSLLYNGIWRHDVEKREKLPKTAACIAMSDATGKELGFCMAFWDKQSYSGREKICAHYKKAIEAISEEAAAIEVEAEDLSEMLA